MLESGSLSTPTAPPSGPGASRRRWLWPALKALAVLAALGVAAYAVSGKTGELTGVGDYLDDLRWWWMVVAVVAEVLSYAALSSLQRRLLRSAQVRVPALSMLGITMAGAAIQYTFPGGGVIYLAYLWRQFKRYGADDLIASWVVLAFNVVTFVALAVLAAIGLGMAFSTGSALDLVGVIGGIVALAGGLVVAVRERRRLLPHAARTLRLSQRLFKWPHPDRPAVELVSAWTAELTAVTPSRRVWARAFVLGLANWLADLSCLALAFYAVGVGVPWRGLLLAYGAGQLASLLPITPGGLGAVEGSLTVALVTFGGGTESTVAAVLLYRLVSFWMMLPVGWAAWGALAVGAHRRGEPAGGRRQPSAVESGA